MKRIVSVGCIAALFFVGLSVAFAQGQFTLVQSGAGNSGASSGGVYDLRDVVGAPDVGSSSGGTYQLIGGLVLGDQPPASTFTLTVNKNGAGTITLDPPGGVYPAGTVVKLTATPATGFTFTGWSGAVSSTAASVQVTMDSDKTISATFVQTSPGNHTLTINIQGQGTVTLDPPGNSYADGQVVKLTAIPGSGFTFTGWSGAASGTTNPLNLTMNGDQAVIANFAALAQNFMLTVNKIGNGTVTLDPPGGTYPVGTVVQIAATPAVGFAFVAWTGAALSTSNPLTLTMNSNQAITANFIAFEQNFTLSVNQIGNGTVMLDPPGGVYPAGTVVKLTATPATGFTFGGWSGALSSTATSVQVTMDSHKTISATFSQTSPGNHTLNVNVVGQGTVTLDPPGNSYTAGTVVQLTATPGPGFTFTGWSGGASGTANPLNLTMNGDQAITANFAALAQNFTLSVNKIGNGTVTLEPAGGTYPTGTVVKLTATPATGFTFAGWSGAASSTTTSVQVAMNSDQTINATFTQISSGNERIYLPIIQR